MKNAFTLFVLAPFFIFSQNDKKMDSLLNIIQSTKVDTIKASTYLELSNLTMYNDQVKTNQFLKKAQKLYTNSNNGKGIAKLYAQQANYFYRLGQIDSARYYLSNSVEKSIEIQDTLRAAAIRHNIGILDHYQGNNTSATEVMKINIPIFKKYKDTIHLANAYLMKGKIAMSDGYYNIALEETHSALKAHKEIGEDFRIAEDLLQVGIIYQATDEHQKAIDIFKESIDFYDKVESEQSIAQALNYMAHSQTKLKNYEDAEENLKKSLSISKKLEYKANIARVYENLGNVEFAKENYTQSIKYFNDSYNIWKTIGSPNHETNLLYFLGRSYASKKEYPEAIKYLNKSIAVQNSSNYPKILSAVFLQKSMAQESLGNYKKALTNFKQSKILSDSIFNIERTAVTQELKIIYETEKKEQQIILQENEITVLGQQAEISNLQKLLLGLGLGLSLLLFGVGYYALRQKIKRNKLEKEKLDAELAFKKKELTTHALHLAKKNEALVNLKQKAEALKTSENNKNGYQQLIRTINFDLQDDNNWEKFSNYFQEVHKDFNTKAQLKFPQITSNDLRYMALIKMNLSSKEIANILNISNDGIKKARHRLRKKIKIDSKQSLEATIIAI